MSAPEPGAASAAWAEEVLGGACRFRWLGARTWTARSASGRSAVLKEPSSLRKHGQERRALAEWAPLAGSSMPRLIAARDRPPALLSEALPGRPGDRCLGYRELELAAHHAAGAALGRLHASGLRGDDELSLAEALPRRLEAWSERAAPLLESGLRSRLRESFGDGSAFAGVERVPCHRDFEPRNWLVELEENRLRRLAIVDFEHARFDAALVDLVKLECGAWRGRDELRREFLEAHGGALEPRDEERLRRLVSLHLLATLVRCAAEGRDAAARAAREQLEQRLRPRAPGRRAPTSCRRPGGEGA